MAFVTGTARSILIPDTVVVVELPARSVTVAEADRLSPSPVTVESAGHVPSMPDRASEHVQWTTTSPRYHPPAFGWVVTAPVRTGLVLSMSMPPTVVESLLPARSVAVPLTDWFAPWERVDALLQSAIPESPTWSAQENDTVTSALYQPLTSALRSAPPLI